MFHQPFECFEILTILEFLSQALLTMQTSKFMMFSSDLISDRLEVLMDEIFLIKSLMNNISSLLPLVIECFWSLKSCSSIGIITVREVWSDNNLYSGWIVWLSNLTKPYLRNMKSMTEFKLWSLFKYLVVKITRSRLSFSYFYFIFYLFSFILFLELGLGLE